MRSRPGPQPGTMQRGCTAVLLLLAALQPCHQALVVQSAPAARVARFLASEARRLQSPELTSLAQVASAYPNDSMDKVKKMISHLLAQKLTEHAEDTDHHGFCSSEMGKSEKKVKHLQDEIEKGNADLDSLNAKLAELTDSISDMHEELAKAQKTTSEALKLRQEEKDTYDKSKADLEQHEAKLARAHAQMDDEAKAAVAEKAVEDLALKRVKEEQLEQRRQFEYERSSQDLEVLKASKTKQAENSQREVTRLKRDIVEKQSDLRGTQQELDAAKSYHEQLKPQCTVHPEPAKERKQRREDEIASLKDAYSALNGETIALPL